MGVKRAIQAAHSAVYLVLYVLSSFLALNTWAPTPVSADGGCSQAGYYPVSPATPFITNGNFSTSPTEIPPDPTPGTGLGYDNTTPAFYYASAGFYSQVAHVGDNIYPSDTTPSKNQFSIQTGLFDGVAEGANPDHGLNQVPFPGDPAFGIPGTSKWWYSNGNAVGGSEYLIWGQQISGLTVGKEYVFVAYISNVIDPDAWFPPNDAPDDPMITMRIGDGSIPIDSPFGGANVWDEPALTEVATRNTAVNNGWVRVDFSFVATSPIARLKLVDRSTGYDGDDFAVTAMTVQECVNLSGPTTNPYLRAFGNDVYAGGGYSSGLGCATPISDILANGDMTSGPGPNDHSKYIGAGSELAAFASGSITGFLPGAGVGTARFASTAKDLAALSYANLVTATYKVNANTLEFAGGYGVPYCAPDFPSTAGYYSLGAGTYSIANLLALNPPGANGVSNFVANVNDITISGGQVPLGVRIRIVAAGDPLNPGDAAPVISGNITYAENGAAGSGWSTFAQIPYFELLSNGSLFIDHGVGQIAGTYKAKGTAYTCSNGRNILYADNRAPFGQADIIALCNNQLLIFGSMTAQNMQLYRIVGDVASGAVGERYGASPLGNVAEVFAFSPELYLSLLALNGPATISTDTVDAIRVLPPAF